ncbi:MAG TPA: hypothetical protein VJY39_01070 [Acidisphaera sp.]|nr:hypothetical protein [Acidisphaera sp.]
MSGASVSLELLQTMIQRVLDGQKLLRDDVAALRRRVSRVEHALLSLQRSQVDRTEAEADTQDQIDSLAERMERLESRGA